MEFDGKVALITGGGTGIGKEVAQRLLSRGARGVVINGRRGDVLERTASELDSSGKRVVAVSGSIGEPDVARAMVARAGDQFGGVDILINNAGIFAPKPFLEHTAEDLSRYLNVILEGTFFASQAATPAMRERGGGAIVNVGSMWADHAVGATPSSAYSAAKAGVHALTRNLAIELASDHIRVNAVAPAVVDTPVYETFIPKDEVAETLATFHSFHPIGRNGQPGDVAEAVLFLAGPQSAWTTGAVLAVDGGVTAGRV